MTWIRLACESNDVPELAQAIQVEWNRRFTRRMGDACYSPFTFRAKIRLSIPLWPRASEMDRRETVIHEACHIVVKYKFGSFVRDHGAEWQQAMRNCGVEPRRTHNVDRSGFARRQRRFILLDCPNKGIDHKCRMTAREYSILRRGAEMCCKVCGLHLTLESSIKEDETATKA